MTDAPFQRMHLFDSVKSSLHGFRYGMWCAENPCRLYVWKVVQMMGRTRRVMAAAVLGAALMLSACTQGSPDAPGSPSSDNSGSSAPNPSASASSEPDPSVTVPSAAGIEEPAERLRMAVARFEAQTRKAGGATFLITSDSSDKKDRAQLAVDGSTSRDWDETKELSGGSVISIVNDGVYSSKSGLDPIGQELMTEVAPDAEWMFESFDVLQYVPVSPARVVESLLAYSSNIACAESEEEAGGTDCTIKTAGMTSVPGFGQFQSPEDGFDAIVTLTEDGDIARIILFPTNSDYNVAMRNVAFEAVTIKAPEGVTVPLELLLEEQERQAQENMPPEEGVVPAQPSDTPQE